MHRPFLFLRISIVALVFVFIADCTSKSDPTSNPPTEKKAEAPGDTVTDGVLSFSAWDQQAVSENPKRNLVALQIEHSGNSGESVSLKRLLLKLTKTDGLDRTVDEKDIDVKSGRPVCVNVPVETDISMLEIRAEDGNKQYGPVIYDFAASKSRSSNRNQIYEDPIPVEMGSVQTPKDKQCFLDTALGCLYEIFRMRIEKLGKKATGPKDFVVLSFRGKGVLNFEKKEFAIKDVELNATYLWSHWVYNGEIMFLPGSSFGTSSGPIVKADNGPILLQDCWHFKVFYEVPENVRLVKLEFKGNS